MLMGKSTDVRGTAPLDFYVSKKTKKKFEEHRAKVAPKKAEDKAVKDTTEKDKAEDVKNSKPKADK